MTTALLQVRQALGPDALIIGTRSYQPTGIRRLWERPYVEVFAGRTAPGAQPPAAAPTPYGVGGGSLSTPTVSTAEATGLVPGTRPTAAPAQPAQHEAFPGTSSDAAVDEFEQWLQPRLSRFEPRSLALVGPTGGGKTTTLAKLAARYALDRGERVGLVTTDTYRIGAVHHLQTYAEIMGLPWKVAQDPPAMREAVAALAYCDRILIDTSGRNFRREEARRELLALLAAANPESVELVLSLTTGHEEMEELAQYFKDGPLTRVLLTKLDEASSIQKLVTALKVFELPLFAVTNGQMVPDDIWFPGARQLAQAIAREAVTVDA